MRSQGILHNPPIKPASATTKINIPRIMTCHCKSFTQELFGSFACQIPAPMIGIERSKATKLMIPMTLLLAERDLRKKKSLFVMHGGIKFERKKKGVRPAIALIMVFWPDEASMCGMVAEECWAGASFWRRDGGVDDSSFSFFRMFSTISSINSVSGLQLEV